MRRVTLLALLAGTLAVAAAAGAYTVLDFVIFDGIEYLRSTEEPGRPLTRDDLGPEFAVVGCGIAENPRCPYGDDASAGLLPARTRMYTVRGYRPEFRLAAVSGEHVMLYQAWRSARAKVGGDLYDIAGKVRAIDVRRDGGGAKTAPAAAMIKLAPDVDAVAKMIVAAPVRPHRPREARTPRYWLTFWLDDGTTLGRAYFPDSGELTGGVTLPPEFRAIVDRSFGE